MEIIEDAENHISWESNAESNLNDINWDRIENKVYNSEVNEELIIKDIAPIEKLSVEEYILSLIQEILNQSILSESEINTQKIDETSLKKGKKSKQSLVKPKVFTNRVNKSKTDVVDPTTKSIIPLVSDSKSDQENSQQKIKKSETNFIERNKQRMKEQEEKRKKIDQEKK